MFGTSTLMHYFEMIKPTTRSKTFISNVPNPKPINLYTSQLEDVILAIMALIKVLLSKHIFNDQKQDKQVVPIKHIAKTDHNLQTCTKYKITIKAKPKQMKRFKVIAQETNHHRRQWKQQGRPLKLQPNVNARNTRHCSKTS